MSETPAAAVDAYRVASRGGMVRSRAIVFVAASIVVGAAAGAGLYFRSRGNETTDDARVNAHVAAVAPRAPGRVKRLLVHENQAVDAGELLVELDPEESDLAVRGSEATFELANAQLRAARADESRLDGVTSRLGATKTSVETAVARVNEVQVAVDIARLRRTYADVRAPMAGIVSHPSVEIGQYVSPDRAIMAIVQLEGAWIEANFKEEQAARMQAGMPARITLDAYPDMVFAGHVDGVGAACGARFALLPPDNASGNFIKVVQRVPVVVRLDKPSSVPLRPGLSATVTVGFGG